MITGRGDLTSYTIFMNPYAIVEAGGEQLQVQVGRFYPLRCLVPRDCTPWDPTPWGQGTKLLLSRVLLVRSDERGIVLGAPWVAGATVKGRLLHVCCNHKLIIYKMHRKKKTRRKHGYKQNLGRFVVDSIELDIQSFVD